MPDYVLGDVQIAKFLKKNKCKDFWVANISEALKISKKISGLNGGEIIYQGLLKDIFKEKKSLTTKYLSGNLQIPIPKIRRKLNKLQVQQDPQNK